MATANGNKQQTAMVVSSADRFATLKKTVDVNRAMLLEVMPPHARQSPDKIFRCVTTAIMRDPKLLDCTPASILLATAQTCVLGLEPNTIQQLAFIVPFKNQAQLIVGWRGLRVLALNSGEVTDIVARPVYEKDIFKLVLEPEEKCIHEPFDGDGGAITRYYSRALWADGRRDYERMYPAEIDKIRNAAPSKDSDAWVNHYPRMAQKTVLRRHCGRMTLKAELVMKATVFDARQEAGKLTRADVEDIVGKNFVPAFDEMTGEVPDEPKDRGDALADKV